MDPKPHINLTASIPAAVLLHFKSGECSQWPGRPSTNTIQRGGTFLVITFTGTLPCGHEEPLEQFHKYKHAFINSALGTFCKIRQPVSKILGLSVFRYCSTLYYVFSKHCACMLVCFSLCSCDYVAKSVTLKHG